MRIEHVGLMVEDLEVMRLFYEKYFKAVAGVKYHNPQTTFQSYFLTFSDGTRLEIGTRSHLNNLTEAKKENRTGYSHLAFSLASKEAVDDLAAVLRSDGFSVKSGPRTTGDGYYEAVILDPEANEIEITI